MISEWRRSLARTNAALGLLLLVAGGLVTSTASGLAVPDWPLSYGRWMPEMTGGVFYEHGHRMFAAAVGLSILAMALLTQAAETRPGVRRLAWGTGALVALQGALGGITVWFALPVETSSAHAVIGQTIFVLLVLMSELQDAACEGAPSAPLTALCGAATLAVWLQLAVGAALRHGAPVLAWHVGGAIAATALALWAAGATAFERREPALRQPAVAVLGLLCLQLFLGALAAGLRLLPNPRGNYAMIAFATAHLAVGAFLLGVCALLTLRLARVRPE